jgi:hypothetical protein
MKNLQLRAQQIGGAEFLSRNQMKHILGGTAPVTDCVSECFDGEICKTTKRKCAYVNCMSVNPTTLYGVC